jgi:hypothetical protein
MSDGDLSRLKPADKKAKPDSLTAADVLNLGTTALHLVGGWKTDAALWAFKAGGGRLLESALPALLICVPPVKEVDGRKYLKEASAKFDGGGEAMRLARKKVNDFENFSGIDNAKLLAFWRFPKANELKEGTSTSVDKDAEEAFCLLFRKGLTAKERKDLPDSDVERLGKRAREPLSDAEEMKLKALTLKILLERKAAVGLDKEESAELDSCTKAILDRSAWSKKLNDPADKDIRKYVDDAYRDLVNFRASALRLNLKDEYGGPRCKDFLTTVFAKEPTVVKTADGEKFVFKVKPGFEDAVLLPNGDVERDREKAQALAAEGKALTREEVLFGMLLNRSGWSGKSHEQQEDGINETLANLFGQKKAKGGKPFGDGVKVTGLGYDTEEGDGGGEKKSIPEWIGILLAFGLKPAALGWGIAEAVNIHRSVAAGKPPVPLIFKAVKGLVYDLPKGIKDRLVGPAAPDGDVASRLGTDKMYRPKTRSRFKSQAESTIKGLDVAKDAKAAGEKVSKFMNDFASFEGLDPRLAKDKLAIEVDFTSDPVTKTAGMERGAVSFTEVDGVTTMKITFPADTSPKDIAHDCYASLYELERSGKGDRRALTRADRLSVSADFADMGVDLARPESGDRVADGMPDKGRGVAPDPVVIVFAEDGVTIGGHKYGVKQVAEAIRDELKEQFDKVKRDGKKKGDTEFDNAEKLFNEHEEIVRNLDHPTDAGIRGRAQKAALDKAKEAYTSDDGKRGRALAEDPRRAGDKGRGRTMTLLLFAEKYATPAALIAAGLWGASGSARGDDTPIKPATLVPIIPIKKKKQ